MRNHKCVEVHVVFDLTADRLVLNAIYVSNPHEGGAGKCGKQNWYLLAALLLEYRIRMFESPALSTSVYDAKSVRLPSKVFHSAWNLIKNHLNKPMPKGDGSRDLAHRWIKGIHHHGESNLSISIDPRELPWGNVTFGLIPEPGRGQMALTHPPEWQVALDGLLEGKLDGIRSLVHAHHPEVLRPEPFRFGRYLTKTYIAESFPDGVMLDEVECHHVSSNYSMPAELMPLVREACEIVWDSTPLQRQVINAGQFAPVKIERIRNYDDDTFEQVRIWLADSHYDFYTAASYAEALARYDSKFEPLKEFVDRMTDPRIPSPASCSLGTRIMLETKDHRLVICYRSRGCKMNPDMWSTSANEGVRPLLIKNDLPFSKLLEEAAQQALYNELRLEREAIGRLLLLSLHQNAYAQWGATIYASTELLFEQVHSRALRAPHRDEHNRVSSLPTNLKECGREMLEHGSRWYGGALEAICTVLSWREVAANNHVSPDEVGRILSGNAEQRIIPCDEVNMDFLRLSA